MKNDKFPEYDAVGKTLAKNIQKRVGSSPITQFGAVNQTQSFKFLGEFWH